MGCWRSAAQALPWTGCSRWPGSIRPSCSIGSPSAASCRSTRWRRWPGPSPAFTPRRIGGPTVAARTRCDGWSRVMPRRSSRREAVSWIGTRAAASPRPRCRRSSATAPLLDQRRGGGFVRECHGDLHLRNIVLLDGAPTLFDAIEFNDDISCVDVALRPGVPADGPVAPAAAAARQRRVERLSRRRPATWTRCHCCRSSCRAGRRFAP